MEQPIRTIPRVPFSNKMPAVNPISAVGRGNTRCLNRCTVLSTATFGWIERMTPSSLRPGDQNNDRGQESDAAKAEDRKEYIHQPMRAGLLRVSHDGLT